MDHSILAVTEPVDGRIVTPAAQLAARLTAGWLGELAPATAAAYAGDLKLWREWCAARGLDPLQARKSDVGTWIREQLTRYSKRTVARRVSAISSWYAFLNEETAGTPLPLAPDNPALTRRRPKVAGDSSPTLAVTQAEARALIAAADQDGLRSAALIRLLLSNGLRVGSVVSAQVGSMTADQGHHVIMLQGKGDKRRKVPLAPPAYNAITKMLAARGNPASGPLFVTRTGRPVDRHYVFRLVRRLATQAGIASAASLSPHSARATFATRALSRGVSLHQLQDDMWHADPRTTQAYNKARDQLDKSAAYVVAGDFEPAADGEA